MSLLQPLNQRRIRCCVPGCTRTTGKPYGQWICAVHWKLVPQRMKRALSRIKRIENRIGAALDDRRWRIWRRIKIEVGAAPALTSPSTDNEGQEDLL